MYYKRSITFRLKTNKNVKGDQKIVIRASWSGHRLEFPTPHNIPPQQWDKTKQRAKGKSNSAGVLVSIINSDLNALYGYMEEIFNRYEFVAKRSPTPDEVKTLYNDMTGKETVADLAKDVFVSLLTAYDKFMSANSTWTLGTEKKYTTLRNHLSEFFPDDMPLEEVTADTISNFQKHLGSKSKLRNVTVERMINRFRTVLRWATERGLYSGNAHIKHKPKLKGTNTKEVITLTPEELSLLSNYEFTNDQQYLERVRDVLLFGCYTGLRYSDLQNLTKADIKRGAIRLVTIKTADPLIIELNDVTRSIIDKYKDFDKIKLLPTISNQKANNYLKELGKLVGIDAPTVITYYDADGRNSEVRLKYELMTTHIARRTFISNALAMGVPTSIVMAWSGHKDFKAMEPYIKMIDSYKRKEMGKFNTLIEKNKGGR